MVELEPGQPPTPIQITPPSHSSSRVDMEAAYAIEGLQALAQQVTEVTTVQDAVTALAVEAPAPEPAPVEEPGENIQLSEEQVMQLSTGDYLEINGEMYKVEFTEETVWKW